MPRPMPGHFSFVHMPTESQQIIGIVAAAIVGAIAWRARLLKPSGAIAAFVLGSVVFGVGGLMFSVPLMAFFTLSSVLSRLGARAKAAVHAELDLVFEKGSRRDAAQVFANGGIAGLLVLVWADSPTDWVYVAYISALAAAAADTWATEIGVLGRGATISMRTLQRVPRGESGGVSLLGSLGALAGALSVAASAGPWYADVCDVGVVGGYSVYHGGGVSCGVIYSLGTHIPFTVGISALLGGLAGAFADSIAGATLQARYRCGACGRVTERREHCGAPAEHIAGLRWITNDAVNILCCLVGAAVGAAVWWAVL